jgi:hypothetical protein
MHAVKKGGGRRRRGGGDCGVKVENNCTVEYHIKKTSF